MQGDRYDSLMDVVGYPPPLHPRHRGPAAWSEVVAWTTAGVVTERIAACPLQVRSQISLVTTTGLLVGHRW